MREEFIFKHGVPRLTVSLPGRRECLQEFWSRDCAVKTVGRSGNSEGRQWCASVTSDSRLSFLIMKPASCRYVNTKSLNTKHLAEHLALRKHSIKGSYHNYYYFSQVSVEGRPELKAFCLIPFPSQTAPFLSPFLPFLSRPGAYYTNPNASLKLAANYVPGSYRSGVCHEPEATACSGSHFAEPPSKF